MTLNAPNTQHQSGKANEGTSGPEQGSIILGTKNECGKTRPASDPYEVWVAGDWTWNVLKKYQSPAKEAENPYARWFCLVVTPIVPRGELGDVYVTEITRVARRVK